MDFPGARCLSGTLLLSLHIFQCPCLGLSSEERWLVQGLVPLLASLLLGLHSLQPAFLGAVLAPGLARYGGASAGPAKAQLLCLPVAFPCLNPVSLLAMWELAPGMFVSSPALGPFLWGDANSLLGRLLDLWLGRLLDLRLPGRFGLCFLWRRRDVYGVLESMAFTEVCPSGTRRTCNQIPPGRQHPRPGATSQSPCWTDSLALGIIPLGSGPIARH